MWFQDEARVGQQGTLTRIWARRGTRPRAVRDTRYEWAYLFGAACPGRGVAAGLVLPCANTEAMNLHLAEIARTVAPEAHAILLLDGAGWHGGKDLVVPENITLLKLPPHSPELDSIENVWQYLRANNLAITLFDSCADILEKCSAAWNFFANDTKAIVSITSRDWVPVSLQGRWYELVDVGAVAQDETVDQRLPYGGRAPFISAIDQAEGHPGFVACQRNAKHQLSPVWALDHLGNGIGAWRLEPDSVELTVLKQPSSGVGAIITKLMRRSFAALA